MFRIDYRHVDFINKVFLECINDEGDAKIGEVLSTMDEMNIKFPEKILTFFLNLIRSTNVFKPNDKRPFTMQAIELIPYKDDDLLSLKKL